MSAHADNHADDTPTAAPRRVKPHQLAIVLGIGMGLFTLVSGVLPQITKWENTNAVHRTVFVDIPGPLQIVFYTIIPVMIVWGGFMFANRMKNWERGAPTKRHTTTKNAAQRLKDFRAGAYMQTLLRDSAAGLMHSMIYFGFLVLLGVTTVLEIDHQLPEDLKFLHGDVYRAYAFVGDAAGLVFLGGIVWAILRRYVQRPYRIRIKSKPEHVAILATFLAIGITGFAAEMFRIAVQGRPGYEEWSFVGYPLSQLVDSWSLSTLETWHQWIWVGHVITFIVFLALLPITMLRHIFTSPLNMYLKDKDRPKGAMRPMPNLTETELESFGASVIEDFTWKQLLDLDACTMCGRCTSVCPAHATGKSLDPREIVLKAGEVMAATGSPVVSAPLSTVAEITVSANSLFERITAEEIWACTTCKACDEICPVNIEITDKIFDMRRYLSLMESNFPTELGNAYRAMENQGNPWGMNQGERGDWADGLDGVTIVDPGDQLHIRVPVLGRLRGFFRRQEQEGHPGHGAAAAPGRHRRGHPRAVGDVHGRLGPSLGQRVPVPDAGPTERRDAQRDGCQEDHHAVPALLQHAAQRVPAARWELRGHPPHAAPRAAHRLRPARRAARPRSKSASPITTRAISAATTTSTSRRARSSRRSRASRSSRCHGTAPRACAAAPAAHACGWRRTIGTKVNDERAAEAISTGASRVATACPFCYIMLDDGVKGAGVEEDQVRVADISIHLLEAIEAGEAKFRHPDTPFSGLVPTGESAQVEHTVE